jgi:hypothetical protein
MTYKQLQTMTYKQLQTTKNKKIQTDIEVRSEQWHYLLFNMCKPKPRQSLLWIQSKWQCSESSKESCSNMTEFMKFVSPVRHDQ